MAKDKLSISDIKNIERQRQLKNNRKYRFIELLGKDCGYIDSLVENESIHPTDVEKMLNNGCPKELIPKILL